MSADSVAVHVAPHPDDEILGAGATLVMLRQQGWRVVALTCTLGRLGDHDRRRVELLEATGRVGFEPRVMDPLAGLSSSDDLSAAQEYVAEAVASVIRETGAGPGRFAPPQGRAPRPRGGRAGRGRCPAGPSAHGTAMVAMGSVGGPPTPDALCPVHGQDP
ncbi:PIG-L deacetylase family protein [Tessaracoccus lacteus]|uniref:PIG-L deacetylase family protein n=1 Tax=Tessaracoccus lacteus TaxID=3041766 RepID=UPI0034DB29FB